MAPQGGPDVRLDGRRRNAKLRGEGVGLDYRPSPRQLRRSSTKRMMQRSLAERFRMWGRGPVCGTGRTNRAKSATGHRSAARATYRGRAAVPQRHAASRPLSRYFTNHGCE
ncbi:hypothetical protein E2C11_05815 [Streptomyces lavendulae]|nr:hypothetical protein E2C11_05815 [Streptomyces lavendulae]